MNPAVTAAWVRKYVTWTNIKRWTAVVVVLVVSVAAWIYDGSRRDTMPPICGVALPHDPFAVRVFRKIDKGGSLAAKLLYAPLPSDQVFVEYLFGTADVIKWFGITFLDPLRASQHWLFGDGPAGVNPYTVAQPCRPAEDACVAPDGPQKGQPYDPKMAKLSGPALAADALRRANFPADEIPTFVAIAKHETGFRNVTGPTVGNGTMRGMWQLNDRYWKLPNWQDPYANAVKAKEVRDESVANGNGPYYPWSTWRAAVRDADQYAKFGKTSAAPSLVAAGMSAVVPAAAAAPAPQPDRPGLTSTPESSTPESSTPAPECTTSGGVGGVTIGSWNTAGKNPQLHNSASMINAGAGFADLVGLQEIRDNGALRVPGYGITETEAAVPIIWRKSKLNLIEWKREDSLNGFAKDKSVVWGVWENRATGKRFAAVNTHQLVQGGVGWARQAVKVNAVRARLQGRGLPVVLLGDFNASAPKIRDAFGSAGVGHHIDRVIGFGVKPAGVETLSKSGSDHARVRASFAAPAATPNAPAAGAVPSDPSGKTTMDGKTVSRVVAAQIRLAERKSGINFTVMQGGFGGGDVPASGTSHDWPGVVDLSPGTVEAEKALRQAGFASWARNIPGRSYAGSGAHNHAVSLLDPGNKGQGQLSAWERNGNGLNGGKDPAPHYPLYPELSGIKQGK